MGEKIVAISHSKHRNMFGFAGIEIDEEKLIANVRLAKQWNRSEINRISMDIADSYPKIKWDKLYIDQSVGEHLIKDIKKHDISVDIITTKKNLNEPDDIEKLLVMDKIEMTQLMLSLKLQDKIQFPPKPKETMTELIKQVELFTEHKTEAGGIDYYAPGDELDNLTKALMICCFAARNILAGDDDMFFGGPVSGKPRPPYGPDYKGDSDIVSELSKGPPGRFVHYY